MNSQLVPSANDKLVRALEGIEVANALHSLVSEHASVEKEAKSQVKQKLSDANC